MLPNYSIISGKLLIEYAPQSVNGKHESTQVDQLKLTCNTGTVGHKNTLGYSSTHYSWPLLDCIFAFLHCKFTSCVVRRTLQTFVAQLMSAKKLLLNIWRVSGHYTLGSSTTILT